MGGRNDLVLLAPDNQRWWRFAGRESGSRLVLLRLASEQRGGELLKEGVDAVETLVLQDVFDKLATDEALVGEELLEHGFQVLAALCRNEGIDIAADLRAEARRADEGQAVHLVRILCRHVHGDRTAHGMADEMRTVDPQLGHELGQCRGHGRERRVGQGLG